MKKNERLMQELLFVHQAKRFTLQDLMSAFTISKRTALRDIAALEELGAPLYSVSGRHGGYQLIGSPPLPPLYFTSEEWGALFFSLQLLKSMANNPFNQSYAELRRKLQAILPEKEQSRAEAVDRLIHFHGAADQDFPVPLSALFLTILQQKVLFITYDRYRKETRHIQPLSMNFVEGNWYIFTWDLDREAFRTFRVEFITNMTESEHPAKKMDEAEIQRRYQYQAEKDRPLSFTLKLAPNGLDLFRKKNYENMHLIEKDDGFLIKGTFGEAETDFMVQYCLAFGDQITILEPASLQDAYCKKLQHLLLKYG
ncbi:helix-turn-helix transcriptional regulator [Listeria costaricensis]|uniref:helix-turn-helix transcriptional regulator n=1 Tax=Listeria costaricensis TaxID=2026604 RepID=UPI000C0727A0|nr:YafY family protein [Listeria costaricensis]